MSHFLQAGGHLGLRAAVNQECFFGAHAQGCAHGVHGGVAAADYGHASAAGHGCGVAFGAAVHEVDAGEVLVAGEDVDEVFTGDAHESGQAGAAGHEDAFEAVGHEVVVAQGLAYHHVGVELHAHGAEGV